MPSAEKPPPTIHLLDLLELIVRGDGAVPGFRARLAFGVRDGDSTRWWEVVCDAKAQSEFVATPSPQCDGTMLIGHSDMETMVTTGKLPPSPALLEITGDARLLSRFVERYVKAQDLLALRTR